MTEQQQQFPPQNKDLPTYMNKEYRTYEKEDDWLDTLQRGFWPIAMWVILLANTLIAWSAIAGVWANGYNPANHFFMTISLATTIAILAFIHRYILNNKK